MAGSSSPTAASRPGCRLDRGRRAGERRHVPRAERDRQPRQRRPGPRPARRTERRDDRRPGARLARALPGFRRPDQRGPTIVRFSFDLFIGNRADDFSTPSPACLDFGINAFNQQVRVDLLVGGTDPFSVAPADVLQNIYQSKPGDPLVSGYTTIVADLRRSLRRTPARPCGCGSPRPTTWPPSSWASTT